MLKFKKQNGQHVATRWDGQVIRIEKSDCADNPSTKWVVRFDGDFDGDNTAFAGTKRELIENENFTAANM